MELLATHAHTHTHARTYFHPTQAMFQAIGDMPAAAGHKELRTFTVCVGRRATPADFFASDVKVNIRPT